VTRRFLLQSFLVLLLAQAMLMPAAAGQWVAGGMFDVERGVGVSFLRFLAAEGEGQMTVRCDTLDGLWIDVGAGGNGELPPGVARGDQVEAVLAFVSGAETQAITVSGSVLVRIDGAVLIEIFGDNAAIVAPLLLAPAERVEVTLAGVTRPITLDGFSDQARNLADRCPGWPAASGLPPEAAAPGTPTIEAQVTAFVEVFGAGLPEFILEAARSCFVGVALQLEPAVQQGVLQAPDFIAGVNAATAANPGLAETLFPALDACGGTLIAGEIMWLWVQQDWQEATEAERVIVGTCLIGAVDRLTLDAKRGIMRFGDGDFAQAIEAMLVERADLAGTIVEDMAACNAPL
jgi:hypothetical protein